MGNSINRRAKTSLNYNLEVTNVFLSNMSILKKYEFLETIFSSPFGEVKKARDKIQDLE